MIHPVAPPQRDFVSPVKEQISKTISKVSEFFKKASPKISLPILAVLGFAAVAGFNLLITFFPYIALATMLALFLIVALSFSQQKTIRE